MSKRTREEKSAKSQQLAKPDVISIGRRFAQPYGKARLLIDHPHSYREWNKTWKRIVGIAKGLSSFLRGQGFQPIGWRDCFTNARSSSAPNNIGDFSLRIISFRK